MSDFDRSRGRAFDYAAKLMQGVNQRALQQMPADDLRVLFSHVLGRKRHKEADVLHIVRPGRSDLTHIGEFRL